MSDGSPVRTLCEPCGVATPSDPTHYKNVYGLGVDLIRCRACGAKRYDRRISTAEDENDSPAAWAGIVRARELGGLSQTLPGADASAEQAIDWTRETYAGLVAQLRLVVGRLDRLFEVGASFGTFLDVARRRGISRVAGCEPNRQAVEFAREDGLDVEHAFFATSSTVRYDRGDPWDAVAMLDVIEHTETPRGDLERALALLRPGGALLLKTFYDDWHDGRPIEVCGPETHRNWGDVLGKGGYFGPVGHLWHLDRAVLRALIGRVGFEIATWTEDETWGQVTVIAVRP